MPKYATGPYIDHSSLAMHSHAGIEPFQDRLHVVTCMFNPMRSVTRYKHYHAFAKGVEDAGALLYTVELALGEREFEVTERDNPRHLQLRTWHMLWYKENLQNLAVMRLLPRSWRKVAFVDADIKFARPDWAQECLQQLEVYMVLQMFSHFQDLGPAMEPIGAIHTSYMYEYINNLAHMHLPHKERCKHHRPKDKCRLCCEGYPGPKAWGVPGGAWAWRREAFDYVGGLIDWDILGSADLRMAAGLVGLVEDTLVGKGGGRYLFKCRRWQELALKHLKKDVGYMPGLAYHYFHGSKKLRYYGDRWRIPLVNKFDPDHHLVKDNQGLWQLNEDEIGFRDDIRLYMSSRNEDDISV